MPWPGGWRCRGGIEKDQQHSSSHTGCASPPPPPCTCHATPLLPCPSTMLLHCSEGYVESEKEQQQRWTKGAPRRVSLVFYVTDVHGEGAELQVLPEQEVEDEDEEAPQQAVVGKVGPGSLACWVFL